MSRKELDIRCTCTTYVHTYVEIRIIAYVYVMRCTNCETFQLTLEWSAKWKTQSTNMRRFRRKGALTEDLEFLWTFSGFVHLIKPVTYDKRIRNAESIYFLVIHLAYVNITDRAFLISAFARVTQLRKNEANRHDKRRNRNFHCYTVIEFLYKVFSNC